MIRNPIAWAIALALPFAAPASASTLVPGVLYEGAFSVSPDDVVPNPCCPIVSIQDEVLATGYQGNLNQLAPGESLTFTLLDADRQILATQEFASTGAVPILGGFGLGLLGGSTTVTSGFVQASTTSELALTGFALSLRVDGEIEVTLPGDVVEVRPTNFVFGAAIDLQPVVTVEPPAPGVIPLPAAGFLLLSGLAGLAVFGRRRAA